MYSNGDADADAAADARCGQIFKRCSHEAKANGNGLLTQYQTWNCYIRIFRSRL